MVSKTRLLSLVRKFKWKEARRGLDETPDLIKYRDDRGRNFLHLCCMVNVKGNDQLKAKDSVKLAGLLIERGLDPSEEAFRRGSWKATPLWHALSRGKNIELGAFLLEQGCDPDHCLWSAAMNDEGEVIELLIRHGAEIDPIYEGDDTPLLTAVKGGHWRAAEALLDLGANVDFQDSKKRTALHWSLKNMADINKVRLLLDHSARGNIKESDGHMAADIMKRKKDPTFRKMAEQYF